MSHKAKRKGALIFPLSILAFGSFIYSTSSYPNSVVWGAVGGLLAFYGVVVMALPVLRVGPYQWISNLYLTDLIDKDKSLTNEEKEVIEDQKKSDLFVQQIIGPYLIGIGTFVNGISGFF